jgi:hypothetical protein
MADNGPISVSAPGKTLVGASSSDVTFSTRFPFHKLDSTNPVGFQVLTVFFNSDTPTPPAASGHTATNKTLVYQYAHGYKYVSSSWFLISLDNFSTVLGSEGSWIVGNASGISPGIAQFVIEVDATNVTFYVTKSWTNDGVTAAPSVLGFFVTVRAYIFVEGLAGDSVPTHE